MISIQYFLLLSFLFVNVLTQTQNFYTAYQRSFTYVTTCSLNQYYDTALLQCSPCPTNLTQKSGDVTQCDCIDNTYYYSINQGGGSIRCARCNATGHRRSTDGFGCTLYNPACNGTNVNVVLTESVLNGNLYSGNPPGNQPRVTNSTCVQCQPGTWSDINDQRCTPCASVTPHPGVPPTTIDCCTSNSGYIKDGMCLFYLYNRTNIRITPNYFNRFSSPTTSLFFQQHLDAAFYLCLMNINSSATSAQNILSNVTACHLLANIAAMQFYYPLANYAYNLYNNYIWIPSQTFTDPAARRAIPFLSYPSTYYSEITNSSYNWIPTSSIQNNVLRIKLAKYSPTGKYLGTFDANDGHLQLCGGAYTDGRPAFIFGTIYNRTCTIRADALWSSTLYETAFFDPYIVFTQSGTDRILPIPVVIRNYRTESDSTPNLGDNEAQWIYHRRFFLIDRISGLVSENDFRSIHYAKSIRILNTLTNGVGNIQPPLILIEYDQLTSSDIGKGTLVQISFETQYRMNLDTHIRDIWIAIGVLCGLGIIFALIETIVWHKKAGKDIIDLITIGKFLLYIINAVGTIFFIVMAGVSLWWLIFFKRQDTVYFVIPTSLQQASFTSLVIVAFVLKTIDILHLIIRQSNIDIFFMDWEKPKTGNPNSISVWRSYYVANEFNEIQSFRRINVTIQIICVLFFLKVINLENVATAQPAVNVFPSSADYSPQYNGILRVGIAFSMWLGTAVLQYLIYILFYQRFVEDKIINFIDFCSLANISVFILTDNRYGYYIHGQSPHGMADVNMKQMLINFQREKDRQIGTRGLQANSDDQLFIIRVNRAFRSQYEILLKNYQNRILTHLTKKTEEHESEILLASYNNLNEFLCGFVHHSLPTYDYVIYNRLLFEKILNFEFRGPDQNQLQGRSESIFFIDPDRNFTKILFSGYENSLFIWNMATFLFIDYFAFNYVLAAVITYLLDQIVVKIRDSLGQRNLSKKTLIPKNFLI